MIAEAANPEWVSVPLIGWQLAQSLRRVANVHLVTQVRNKAAIARAGLQHGIDFTAIDSERLAAAMWRIGDRLRGGAGKGWTTVAAAAVPAYWWFEYKLWQELGSRIRAGEWDIVHRVTPLSPTIPSIIGDRCRRAGVAFMIGPLNGGTPWPAGFDATRRAEKEWLSYVRGAYRVLPGHRATRRAASAILVGSRATYEQEPRRFRDKCVFIPENAVDLARFSARRARTAGRPLKLVFVGRLVPYKGADMVIEGAAPMLRAGTAVLEIIGDGPQRAELEALVQRLECASTVTFRGWVEHSQLQHRLAEHDVFAFPSVREFGGGAVLEAMAVGLVPLVVDYGGPGELVTAETGLKITLGTRPETIAALRAALQRLVDQPGTVDSLSPSAVARVSASFTWDRKAEQVARVYEWVLGRAPKPSFRLSGWASELEGAS